MYDTRYRLVPISTAAIDNDPDNAGLVANLALAHMLNEEDTHAVECAERAARTAPDDEISHNVLALVRDVAAGRRPRPKTLLDAFSE